MKISTTPFIINALILAPFEVKSQDKKTMGNTLNSRQIYFLQSSEHLLEDVFKGFIFSFRLLPFLFPFL